MLLAIPMGQLADRVGRARVFVGGYALLLVVYSALFVPHLGAGEMVLYLALLGAYYAATDGVLMAAASGMLPEEKQGSGLGLLLTATTLAKLAASLTFGLLWTTVGLEVAAIVFAAGLAIATTVAAVMIGRPRRASA
jgi:MFS family permease